MKETKKLKIRVCSFFSGAGGLDTGMKISGSFSHILAGDIKSAPAATYAYNFKFKVCNPGELAKGRKVIRKFVLGDISDLDFKKLPLENIDVVAGGPPCQDFSIVRGGSDKRKGIETRRGKLYSYYVKSLAYFQPKFFVFENVPGLINSNEGKAYSTILSDLSNLHSAWDEIKNDVGNGIKKEPQNYSILYSDIVNSADFGVPQNRRRLIVLGIRKDLLPAEKVYAGSHMVGALLEGKNSLLSKYPLTPLEAFLGKDLKETSNEYRLVMEEYRGIGKDLKTPVAEQWENEAFSKLTLDPVKDYLKINNIIPFDKTEIRKAMTEHRRVMRKLGWLGSPLSGASFEDGSNGLTEESADVKDRLWHIPPGENIDFVEGTKYHVKSKGMSLIYRRIHPLKPSPTIVAFGGGGTGGYHYERKRGALTNRERARLQSFPDKFRFRGNTSEVRGQIGEAVPPLLGLALAEAIKTVLNLPEININVHNLNNDSQLKPAEQTE